MYWGEPGKTLMSLEHAVLKMWLGIKNVCAPCWQSHLLKESVGSLLSKFKVALTEMIDFSKHGGSWLKKNHWMRKKQAIMN